jgi:hypothetical protein
MGTIRANPIHLNKYHRSRFKKLLLIAMLLVSVTAGYAWSEKTPAIEYQVKASYIYNFLQFVEWPPEAVAGGTIIVCVLGEDRFGAALQAISGETVRGQKIAVRHFKGTEGLDACHAVFVSASELAREQSVLQRLDGRPILTIGETSGFTDRGGVINLVRIANNIRFEINQQAAEHNYIKISAQLLQLGLRR